MSTARLLTLTAFLFALAAACADEDAPIPEDPSDLAPPPAGQGFQLSEGDYTVAAGSEGGFCQRYPIPPGYGAEPLYLGRVESWLPLATHHFFMAYSAEPLAEVEPCYGDTPYHSTADALTPEEEEQIRNDLANLKGKMVFGAGVGAYELALPSGYALYLKSGQGQFVGSHHIINFGEGPADMYGVFNVYTADPADIHHPVNILNCLNQNIFVAPHSEADVTGTCTAPFPLDLVILASHAHQYLTSFETRFYDGEKPVGEPIYQSSDWDSPQALILDQPLHLEEGQGLTFNCHYQNDTDETITFGAGDYLEMCATMNWYAYPADRPNEVPPSLGTLILAQDAVVPLIDTTDLDLPF
jgi:hypothetical protein